MTGSCHFARSIGIVTTETNSSTAIECAKLQLPVVTLGCTLVLQKDGENIFPISLIKNGSEDRKLQFSALNCRGTVGFCSNNAN